MTLLERDQALAHFDRLLSDCLDGRGASMVITGPVGCGKTALLRALGERASRAGALFFGTTASAAERGVQLGVLRDARLLDGARPRPRTESAPAPDRDAAARVRSEVIGRLGRLILDGARHRALVIGIDDVEHADTESLHVLGYLLRRIRSRPVLMVFTQGMRAQPERRVLRSGLLSARQCLQLSIGPLSLAAVQQLLAPSVGVRSRDHLVAQLHAISGGNLALLMPLIEDLHQSPAPRTAAVVGPTFGRALIRCLHRCGRAALRLARGLALLDAPVDPALLGKLVGLGTERVVATSAVLNQAGLLDRGSFSHPTGRAAVLAEIPPEARAALHQRAARLLHEAGAPATVVATYLRAADRPDGSWLPLVLEAVQTLLGEGQVDRAVSCLRLIGQVEPDDARQARIWTALGQWASDAQPAPASTQATASPSRPNARMLSARQGISTGQLSEAEQRVALLAAQGLTNRQIAARLFVTVSTVEQHLTKVYRKLRVHRVHQPGVTAVLSSVTTGPSS